MHSYRFLTVVVFTPLPLPVFVQALKCFVQMQQDLTTKIRTGQYTEALSLSHESQDPVYRLTGVAQLLAVLHMWSDCSSQDNPSQFSHTTLKEHLSREGGVR